MEEHKMKVEVSKVNGRVQNERRSYKDLWKTVTTLPEWHSEEQSCVEHPQR